MKSTFVCCFLVLVKTSNFVAITFSDIKCRRLIFVIIQIFQYISMTCEVIHLLDFVIYVVNIILSSLLFFHFIFMVTIFIIKLC
jgi:hypothetical protein